MDAWKILDSVAGYVANREGRKFKILYAVTCRKHIDIIPQPKLELVQTCSYDATVQNKL